MRWGSTPTPRLSSRVCSRTWVCTVDLLPNWGLLPILLALGLKHKVSLYCWLPWLGPRLLLLVHYFRVKLLRTQMLALASLIRYLKGLCIRSHVPLLQSTPGSPLALTIPGEGMLGLSWI
jgi:hypothetical protein